MIRKQEQRRACPVRCGKLGAASALAWKEEGRVAISTAVEFAMRWRVARQACTRPQIQALRVAASFATAGKDQPHPRSPSAFQLLWAPVLPSLAQSCPVRVFRPIAILAWRKCNLAKRATMGAA